MSETATTPAAKATTTTRLHTIANIIPSMVAPDAHVTVRLHLRDSDTFDALRAEHGDPAVQHYVASSDCGPFRVVRITVNEQEVVLFDSSSRDHVEVSVDS